MTLHLSGPLCLCSLLLRLVLLFLSERMDKNLRFLRKAILGPLDAESSTPSPPNSLVSVLLGFSTLTYLQPDASKTITFLDENLNESQRKAVHLVINETEEVGLIHGPPG